MLAAKMSNETTRLDDAAMALREHLALKCASRGAVEELSGPIHLDLVPAVHIGDDAWTRNGNETHVDLVLPEAWRERLGNHAADAEMAHVLHRRIVWVAVAEVLPAHNDVARPRKSRELRIERLHRHVEQHLHVLLGAVIDPHDLVDIEVVVGKDVRHAAAQRLECHLNGPRGM